MSSPEPITAPGIHDEPPDNSTEYAMQQLVRRVKGFGPALIKHALAQVLYAVAGISIGGVEPFAGLAHWADQLEQQASDAYFNASVAQGSADYANSQITGLLTTDVSGGVALFSTFNGPAATNIGGEFTQVYSGSGGGTWGVDGVGNTRWNASGGLTRICWARHNTPVTTDFQRVRIVLTTKPWSESLGQIPANFLLGRVNSACDTFVYARFSYLSMQLGCVVSGSTTVFDTVSFSPQLGDVIDFYIGTDDDDRELIVRRNGIDVLSYTDSADVSSKGSSYRYVGLGAMATDRNFFSAQSVPGQYAAWAGIDRQSTTH